MISKEIIRPNNDFHILLNLEHQSHTNASLPSNNGPSKTIPPKPILPSDPPVIPNNCHPNLNSTTSLTRNGQTPHIRLSPFPSPTASRLLPSSPKQRQGDHSSLVVSSEGVNKQPLRSPCLDISHECCPDGPSNDHEKQGITDLAKGAENFHSPLIQNA